MTDIPYEKGRFFLGWLESRVGADALHAFLKGYFAHFAFQSITTEQFLAYLDETGEELHTWVYEPGLPSTAIRPQSDALAKVDTARAAFLAGTVLADALPHAAWSTQEWLYFLNNLPRKMPRVQLDALDAAFHLTAVANDEIAFSWLSIAVHNDYSPTWPRLADYLVSIGRRKLVVPLYEALMATPSGAARARDVCKGATRLPSDYGCDDRCGRALRRCAT